MCTSASSQIAYMFIFTLAILLMFSYLIYKQIKGKGNSKKVSSGIIKITLRQFQLAGIISQFPLSWPSEVGAMFSIFNTISTGGSR